MKGAVLDYDLSPVCSMSDTCLEVVDENFRSAVESVERILNYRFADKSLIEAALTHSSYCDATSYQRLEFVGDAVLGLAFANFVFVTYRDLDQGQLSLLRSANISTEKLARVAVQHGFFQFVRHNAPALQAKVDEFALAIQEEGDEILPYGGAIKAPKVLADIVESIAAAIYVDCNFDLKFLWEQFSPIMEPIVTQENLTQQPVTVLYEHCQKHGKKVDFKHRKNGALNITNVVVDGMILATSSAEKKEISKLNAAREALNKLGMSMPTEAQPMQPEVQPMKEESHQYSGMSNGVMEIAGAKQKLIEFCNKKHWLKPIYSVIDEAGPSHDRRFTCRVQIETSVDIRGTNGEGKAKVKDAENSAASMMLHLLKDTEQERGRLR